MAKNDFAVMNAGAVWPEEVNTVIVNNTDVGVERMANSIVPMSLSIDSELNLSNERMNQAFRAHRKLNEDIVFKFRLRC